MDECRQLKRETKLAYRIPPALLLLASVAACAGDHCSPGKHWSTRPSPATGSPCVAGRGCPGSDADGKISIVEVPPSLAAITSTPELSGLAWSSTLSRYLVVSDDTGLKSERTAHLPMLFALAPSGVFDNEPIRIDGLTEINDAESICTGPDGTFFLTTSHSPDKHGRVPESRRMLLHLGLSAYMLRVLGKVDLLQARDGSGKSIAEMASGAPDSGTVDIEALTLDGDKLLIGLKAPLGSNGEASIIALPDAVAALRSGTLNLGAVSLWKKVRLCVSDAIGHACEGISDMAMLKNSTLVMTANAPKGMPTDGGGSIWLLKTSGSADATPELLHHFNGLLPEGVTVAPSGDPLVLVFDAHGSSPKWGTWPLPR